MKTVFIYDQVLEMPLSFLVVDGDYSHLNNCYINSMDCTEEQADEIDKLIFNEDWTYVEGFVEEFPTDEVLKGAKVAIIGFLP